jgi:putative ABC transport system substrate-binding protein
MSPVLALNGHAVMSAGCPLSGVKQKSASATSTSAFDPQQTWPSLNPRNAAVSPARRRRAILVDWKQLRGLAVKRRAFITLIGGVAAWPLAAPAQSPGKLVRIGFLSGGSEANSNIDGFRQGLRQLGYIEGQNLLMIYRWAAGQPDRLVDLARELLESNVDLLASHTTEAITAIRSLNATIPIVMTAISDPIGSGLVASFARPGGATTGVTLFSNELAGKRLAMLREVVPQLTRVAVLAERDRRPTETLISETKEAAHALRLTLQIFEIGADEIADAFRLIDKERPDALIVQQNLSFTPHLRQIADLAIGHRLATVHPTREFVEAGGLLAYGPSIFALGERAAWYTDRILKGIKPADLPVEQPTKFELIVNLKTAKALGLDVPPSLLATADELIE